MVDCHYFPPGQQLPSRPLRGLLPISLLGEQRHNGCEQFACDCYPTASQLRFEPRPSAPESSTLTTQLPSHPTCSHSSTLLHPTHMGGITQCCDPPIPLSLFIPCTELYIPWGELSRHKLWPTLATAHCSCPDNAVGLVAQCELGRYVKLETVEQKFSHRPGNPATVGVARWPAAGDTAGYNLLQPTLTHSSFFNLVGPMPLITIEH